MNMKFCIILFFLALFVYANSFYEHTEYDLKSEVEIILVVTLDSLHSQDDSLTFSNGVRRLRGTNLTYYYSVDEVVKGEYSEETYVGRSYEDTHLIYDDEGNEAGHEFPIVHRSDNYPGSKSGERFIILIGPVKFYEKNFPQFTGYQGALGIDELRRVKRQVK